MHSTGSFFMPFSTATAVPPRKSEIFWERTSSVGIYKKRKGLPCLPENRRFSGSVLRVSVFIKRGRDCRASQKIGDFLGVYGFFYVKKYFFIIFIICIDK